MYKRIVTIIFIVYVFGNLQSQTNWGVKIGPSISLQNWDNIQKDPLFTYTGSVYVESATDDSYSLYAELGYHNRGSAIRYPVYYNNNDFRYQSQQFIFRNIALTAGITKSITQASNVYYLLGLRGEVTIGTNLSEYESIYSAGFYPSDNNVRKLNYGISVGGGWKFPINDRYASFAEIVISPDFSKQYHQFPVTGIYNPYTMQNGTIPERSIKNLSIELKIGFKLLSQYAGYEEYDY